MLSQGSRGDSPEIETCAGLKFDLHPKGSEARETLGGNCYD